MNSRVLVSIRVKALPDRAFEVFTTVIGAWWKPNQLFRFTPRSPGVIALEPGAAGHLTETLSNGKVFEIGRVIIWEPPHRFRLTWRQATVAPDQVTEVEVRFEPIGEETRVTVEHFGWDSVPQDHVARHGFPDGLFLRRHGEWWQALLASYKASLI